MCGGDGEVVKLNGVYTPMARTHDVKRGNGASGEVMSRLRWSLVGEGVGCYVPPSAAYPTGRTKGDPLEFSALGCLSAGRPHNRTEHQRPTRTYATWMMNAIEMNLTHKRSSAMGRGFLDRGVAQYTQSCRMPVGPVVVKKRGSTARLMGRPVWDY